MPRNVRNFWIEGRTDDSAYGHNFGPRTKDGGFEMTIYQRDAGGVTKAFDIRGFLDVDGKLTCMVIRQDKAKDTLTFETER
jgi:hypothetical protein